LLPLICTPPPPRRPCKAVAKPFEKVADAYPGATFLKLYGNANSSCKRMFKLLKIRSTPAFIFFRDGGWACMGCGVPMRGRARKGGGMPGRMRAGRGGVKRVGLRGYVRDAGGP
jgi:hypothetical protein